MSCIHFNIFKDVLIKKFHKPFAKFRRFLSDMLEVNFKTKETLDGDHYSLYTLIYHVFSRKCAKFNKIGSIREGVK